MRRSACPDGRRVMLRSTSARRPTSPASSALRRGSLGLLRRNPRAHPGEVLAVPGIAAEALPQGGGDDPPGARGVEHLQPRRRRGRRGTGAGAAPWSLSEPPARNPAIARPSSLLWTSTWLSAGRVQPGGTRGSWLSRTLRAVSITSARSCGLAGGRRLRARNPTAAAHVQWRSALPGPTRALPGSTLCLGGRSRSPRCRCTFCCASVSASPDAYAAIRGSNIAACAPWARMPTVGETDWLGFAQPGASRWTARPPARSSADVARLPIARWSASTPTERLTAPPRACPGLHRLRRARLGDVLGDRGLAPTGRSSPAAAGGCKRVRPAFRADGAPRRHA